MTFNLGLLRNFFGLGPADGFNHISSGHMTAVIILSVNDGNLSNNHFGNRNVNMANANNIKILYIFFAFDSKGSLDFSIMN